MGSLSCESAGSFLNLSGDEARKPACVQMAAMVSQGGGEGTCLLWKPWLSFSGHWESSARSGSTEPLGALLFSLPVFPQCPTVLAVTLAGDCPALGLGFSTPLPKGQVLVTAEWKVCFMNSRRVAETLVPSIPESQPLDPWSPTDDRALTPASFSSLPLSRAPPDLGFQPLPAPISQMRKVRL